MEGVLNILLTGVGGQGIITLGKVIGEVFTRRGVRVLMAETHGMSQRGGSVVVHVRIGNANYPLIPIGGADALLGLELIETFRYIRYASRKTVIISDSNMIRPGLPNVEMPSRDDLLNYAARVGLKVFLIDGRRLAEEAGNTLSHNMVMLGALAASGVFGHDVGPDDFREVISRLPMSDINLRAFQMGYKALFDVIREV